MTAVNVPRGNPADTASRARTAFLPDPYSFDTESRRTAWSDVPNVGEARVYGESVAVVSARATRRLDGSLVDLMPSDARYGDGLDRYPVPPDMSYS
jgi:hypothetical protein